MSNRQKILIIVAVLAILGIVYNFYQSSKLAPSEEEVQATDYDLVKDLSKIRKLKESQLDMSVFEGPVFKNLESSPELSAGAAPSAEEGAEPGRPNPFLPFQTIPRIR